MTVAQTIAFGLQSLGRSISGGPQQRAALAPAPRILLRDEALSALHLKPRPQMQIRRKRLQAKTGIVLVFVTPDQEEALTLSDRIAAMGAGLLHQVASRRDLQNRPANRFVADLSDEGKFLPVADQADRRVGPDLKGQGAHFCD